MLEMHPLWKGVSAAHFHSHFKGGSLNFLRVSGPFFTQCLHWATKEPDPCTAHYLDSRCLSGPSLTQGAGMSPTPLRPLGPHFAQTQPTCSEEASAARSISPRKCSHATPSSTSRRGCTFHPALCISSADADSLLCRRSSHEHKPSSFILQSMVNIKKVAVRAIAEILKNMPTLQTETYNAWQ